MMLFIFGVWFHGLVILGLVDGSFIMSAKFHDSSSTCTVIDPSVVIFVVRSHTECALQCASNTGCLGFNCGPDCQICSIFTVEPTVFYAEEKCALYEEDTLLRGSTYLITPSSSLSFAKYDSNLTTSSPKSYSSGFTLNYTSLTIGSIADGNCSIYEQIPAENCSFPFTYNGTVYYTCIPNVPGVTVVAGCNQVACLKANRIWAICIKPANFNGGAVATVNLIIPPMTFPAQLMTFNNWILIQQNRLEDTDVSFARNWTDYRNGFGTSDGDYWLGNEKIHLLTTSGNYKLRMELRSISDGRWTSAEYSSFYIDNETALYTLHLSGFSGDGGESMLYGGNPLSQYYLSGMAFTTIDQDHDLDPNQNCAGAHGGGGWWYHQCYGALLNADAGGWFFWYSLGDPAWYLSDARMMIKRV